MLANFAGAHGATAARRIPDPKVGGSNPSGLKVSFSFYILFVLRVRYRKKPPCKEVRAWSSLVMTPASHAGNPEFESRRA